MHRHMDKVACAPGGSSRDLRRVPSAGRVVALLVAGSLVGALTAGASGSARAAEGAGAAATFRVAETTAVAGNRPQADGPLQEDALQVRGTFPMGALGAADIEGSLTWVTQGRWVVALDTGIGAAPQEIGRVMAGVGAHDALDALGSRVVTVGTDGLFVLDAALPSAPVVVGHLAGTATDVRLEGDTAYVADSTALRVVSLVDPAVPVEVGRLDMAVWHFDVANGLVFAAGGDAGLAIWDLTDPAAPRAVGALDTPGSVKDVALAGTVAVVADGGGSILFVDVADPTAPALAGTFDAPADPNCQGGQGCVDFASMAISGHRAYVAWANCGGGFYCRGTPVVRAFDFTDPANPIELGASDMGGQPVAVAAGPGRVVVTERPLWWYQGLAPCSLAPGGMNVFEGDLQLLGRLNVVVGAAALDAHNRQVYVAEPERHVAVIDASDATAPHLAGGIPIMMIGSGYGMGGPTDIAFDSGRAYVSRGRGVVYPPGYAGLNGCAPPPDDQWYRAVAVAGPHLYGLDLGGQLQILDRTGWPAAVGRVGQSATVMDGRRGLAVLSGPGGTDVVDTSNPASPVIIGHSDAQGRAISLAGKFAYLAGGDQGLIVLDLTDPTRPIAREVSTGGSAVSVHASRGLVFAATGNAVLAFDVSEVGQARLVGTAPLPGARMVTAAAPWAYAVADGGLFVLEFTGQMLPEPSMIYLPAVAGRGERHE